MKWPTALTYLWMVYHATAEGMPDTVVSAARVLDAAQGSSDIMHASGSDGVCAGGPSLDEDTTDRVVHKAILDIGAHGATFDSMMHGHGFLDGPRRYLQHSTRTDLFMEYVVVMKKRGTEPASFSTFARVLRTIWGKHLIFRKATTHVQRDVCCGLKRDIKHASSLEWRGQLLERYMKHIFEQWSDRLVWWAIAELSTQLCQASARVGARVAWSSVGASLVAVAQDGMDQSKFRVPRLSHRGRTPHALARLHRPALHVAASWIVGSCMQFFVSDEDLHKDSTTQIEMLARSLSRLYVSSGNHLPLGLHLQQDNTCREGKNQFMLRFMIGLLLLGVFRWCSLGFLRSGHSHDKIDQVFAHMTTVIRSNSFNTPQALVELIMRMCRSSTSRRGTTPSTLNAMATKLDETAAWKDWSDRAGIKFRGHAQKGSPHYFRFCRRCDLGVPISNQGHDCSLENGVPIADFPPQSDVRLMTSCWLSNTGCMELSPCKSLLSSPLPAQPPSAVTSSRTAWRFDVLSARKCGRTLRAMRPCSSNKSSYLQMR